MLKRISLYTLLIILLPLAVSAQYYNTGQEPASLKWKELSSQHFRFIYPESYSNQAVKTAGIFEKSYSLLKNRYGEKELKKFPIIIHNHTIESNGYVAWAPKRMELYPYPGQNSIPLSHTEQLALHELVHVTQMQGLRLGMSKPLEIILGEQYPGALSIFTPFWFLEGDAVMSETAFSYSGRGRQPAFEKGLKALLVVNEKSYTYDKMISGSYKDYTPDHYRFGYQMRAYAHTKIDTSLFYNALNLTARRPWLMNPFNLSLRKDAKLTKKSLYEETIGYIQKEWKADDDKLIKSKFDFLTQSSAKEYTNYYSPRIIGIDSVLAIKTSYSKPPAFVLIHSDSNTEEIILKPGIVWPYYFSYSKGVIVWSEHKPDPRWTNREYSVVLSYNIQKKVLNQLTKKSRLFSPAISNSGKYIVCSESSTEYRNSIVILNSNNGQELERYNTNENELPVNPQWDNKDNKIVFISFSEKGEGIMELNRRSKGIKILIPEGRDDLQSVSIRNDSLFFTSSHSGIDNAYLRTTDGRLSQISSSRFGSSFLSLNKDKLVFSDYSTGGERIATLSLSSLENIAIKDKPADLLFSSEISSASILIPDECALSDEDYTISSYKKWKHLFNIHSWMPFYTDVNNISFDNLSVSPGLTLMSQNHLSTLITSLGYEYKDGEHLIHSSLQWRGWYPAFDLDINYGGTPVVFQDDDGLYYPEEVSPGINASVSIFLPLRFRTGNFSQTLWPSIRLSYKNTYMFEEEAHQFDYGQIQLNNRLYFANLHRMSYRDIWPRWGQIIDIGFNTAPWDKEVYGNSFYFKGSAYTPGLFRNHSLKLQGQYEKQDFKRLIQYNHISLPRGYNDIISGQISKVSADYTMPLLYPDLNIGFLAYLKRIRTSIYFDYASATENYHVSDKTMVHEKEVFISYGAELLADFSILRIPFDFSGGCRLSWLPNEEKSVFSFVLTMDVMGFVID